MPAIPESARHFLRRHIRSAAELEALLLLAESDEQWWTCDLVSEQLRGSTSVVRADLERLAKDGLLITKSDATQTVFRFSPVDATAREVVPLLAQLLRESRPRLIEFIYSRTMRT